MDLGHKKEEEEDERIRLTLEISARLLVKIDAVRKAMRLTSRGATIERLLDELFSEDLTHESPGNEIS